MNPESFEYIERFGYTPEEARFLCLAALHSGYFVCRQFNDFIHRPRGACTQRFLHKLTSRRHARPERYQGKQFVYHIHAEGIYQRLGQKDNRNRRQKAPLTIKRRLMCLDFVMAHSGFRFLDAEMEKLDYFLVERQLAPDLLPSRRFPARIRQQAAERFFVDKQPIYLHPGADGDIAPTVAFAYVDEGARTIQGFDGFLDRLRGLCDALGRFEIVYAAAGSELFDRAEACFHRSFTARKSDDALDLTREAREIIGYFETRRRFETRNFAGLTNERIVQYREEKRKFAGEQVDHLYRRWLDGGPAAVMPASDTPRDPRFRTHLLTENYDMFRRSQHGCAV